MMTEHWFDHDPQLLPTLRANHPILFTDSVTRITFRVATSKGVYAVTMSRDDGAFAVESFTPMDRIGLSRSSVIQRLRRWRQSPERHGDEQAVVVPPGMALVRISSIVFGKKACDTIFSQVVAEMQREYFDALSRGEKWEARWAVGRGRLAFVRTVLKHTFVATIASMLGGTGRFIGAIAKAAVNHDKSDRQE